VPTKIGAISSLAKTGSKFVQLNLDDGQKVELQHPLWDHVRSTYQPGERLIFVERRGRLFRFVHWVGTPEEAEQAVASGILKRDEIDPSPHRPTGSLDVPGVPSAPELHEGDDLADIKKIAIARARAFADGIALNNSKKVQRLIEEIPTTAEDLEAMTLFGGLPFRPASEVRVPYESPWPQGVHDLLMEYELTYFQTFLARLNRRFEESRLDNGRYAASFSRGREAGLRVQEPITPTAVEQAESLANDSLDMDPYMQAWALGYATALRARADEAAPPRRRWVGNLEGELADAGLRRTTQGLPGGWRAGHRTTIQRVLNAALRKTGNLH
jgi:hypothetical protein